MSRSVWRKFFSVPDAFLIVCNSGGGGNTPADKKGACYMSDFYNEGQKHMSNRDLMKAVDCFLKDIEQGNDDSIDTLAFIHKFNPTGEINDADLKNAVEIYNRSFKEHKTKIPKVMIWLGIIYMSGEYGGYNIAAPNFTIGDKLIKEGVAKICNIDGTSENYSLLDPRACIELYIVYTSNRKLEDKNHTIYCLDEAIKYLKPVNEEMMERLLPDMPPKNEVMKNLIGERDAITDELKIYENINKYSDN